MLQLVLDLLLFWLSKYDFLEMVPVDPNLDNEWSEFERFSTNDYIRQLIDAEINPATKIVASDIT